MPMTTLQDLITLAKNRIDEIDVDTQIDTIVQEGINYAYTFKTAKLEPQFASVTIAASGGTVTLPVDLLSIEKIIPALVSPTEYKKGLTLFVNALDEDLEAGIAATNYTIVYKKQRTALASTSATVLASDRLKYLLVTYGCYTYQLYRKRQVAAQLYLDEFNNGVAEIEFDSVSSDSDTSSNEVTDAVFTTTTDDDVVIGNW